MTKIILLERGKEMEAKFNYGLRVRSDDLQDVLKKIHMAKGKEKGFIITISQKGEKTSCTLTTGSDSIQATSQFSGDLNLYKIEKNKEVLSKEPLKEPLKVTVSSVFAEAVTALGFEEFLFLKITENMVDVLNSVSNIPIPIKEQENVMVNPKGIQKLQLTISRDEMLSVLKYVSIGATGSRYGSNYAFRPVYDGQRAYLNTFAATDTSVVAGRMGIIKTNTQEYPALCEELPSVPLDATKFDQIIGSNDSENIVMDFFYRDGKVGKDVVQVNVRTNTSAYIIKPYITCYPDKVAEVLSESYEVIQYSIIFDVKTLKNVIPVLSVGSDVSKKKVEIHVYPDQIIICDEGGLSSKKKASKASIKEVKVLLPEGQEEECFLIGLYQLNKNLKPYEGKVTMSVTGRLLVFKGPNEGIQHGIMPFKATSSTEAVVIDDTETEDAGTDESANE